LTQEASGEQGISILAFFGIAVISLLRLSVKRLKYLKNSSGVQTFLNFAIRLSGMDFT
jgi:hypothetical protein